MLRHEASASDETDASCLSMTMSLKKIEVNSRTDINSITETAFQINIRLIKIGEITKICVIK